MERLTKKYPGGYGLLKVKDSEQIVESDYPNTLKAIQECFTRLGEIEDAVEAREQNPTNFDRITAFPETLAAFLGSINVSAGPWDDVYQRQFCETCTAESCDDCPRNEEPNPAWWLIQEAGTHETCI